jgi:hypothetical protein
MTNHEIDALGKQMWALSQSAKSDPVLKALTYLVWQQIAELRKNPGDTDLHKMMLRMLREVHNTITQRLRAGRCIALDCTSDRV